MSLRELMRVGFHTSAKPVRPLAGRERRLGGRAGFPKSAHARTQIQALQGVPETAVKLLLMHEPDYADEAPPGFALQLSGHSHAGQIRIPGLPPLHCPEYGRRYPEGLQQTTHHPVYTTRGIGMIGPQMRFCCPPEVTILTIQPAA